MIHLQDSKIINKMKNVKNFSEFLFEANKIKEVEKELKDARIGSVATGGGYEWIKIKANTWKTPKGILGHSANVASSIGGFDDFEIK